MSVSVAAMPQMFKQGVGAGLKRRWKKELQEAAVDLRTVMGERWVVPVVLVVGLVVMAVLEEDIFIFDI